MPCACKKPVETYPENTDWGPLFWTVLHGLAEYAGRVPVDMLRGDERRAWIGLMTSLGQTLPCDKCRSHYSEWLSSRPVQGLQDMPYADVSLWIRTWFWALHNAVNARNQKDAFPFEQLTATYKGKNITESWKRLDPVIKRAITLNGISLNPWKKWLNFVRTLQGIYGI